MREGRFPPPSSRLSFFFFDVCFAFFFFVGRVIEGETAGKPREKGLSKCLHPALLSLSLSRAKRKRGRERQVLPKERRREKESEGASEQASEFHCLPYQHSNPPPPLILSFLRLES